MTSLGGRKATSLALWAALLLAFPARAEWQLDSARSNLAFASVKNAVVGEGHRFVALRGRVGDDGSVAIAIDLASVDTLIPIRDERLRELLFEVVRFPEATLTTQVAVPALLAIAVDGVGEVAVEVTLRLRAAELVLPATLRVQRLASDRYRVETLRPVVVTAEQLGLDAGVEKLRAIAGLQTISGVVPVTASFEFVAKPTGE